MIKILFILLVSYGVTQLASFGFFPNNNPTINTEKILYLARLVKEPQQFLALFNGKSGQPAVQFPTDLSSFNKVSKGIYAKEEEGKNITVIKLGEMEMESYSLVIDGNPITVNVPVGSISKEELEKQMNEMKNMKPANEK